MSNRTLMYEPESDSFIEARTVVEVNSAADRGFEDVTGIWQFEEAFRQHELQKPMLPDVNA